MPLCYTCRNCFLHCILLPLKIIGMKILMIIDGEILRVSNGQQQPLQFADNAEPITLEEFIQQVKG